MLVKIDASYMNHQKTYTNIKQYLQLITAYSVSQSDSHRSVRGLVYGTSLIIRSDLLATSAYVSSKTIFMPPRFVEGISE